MSKAWKPGEVATIGTRPLLCIGDNRWADSFGYQLLLTADEPRPLVVIDPEDREAVERLHDLYEDLTRGITADDMQAALREFANPTPPRPDEPTGIGAVVEDADGKRYVRTADTDCRMPWSYANNYTDFEWAQVHAVRVLSEGVQP